jgi:transposase
MPYLHRIRLSEKKLRLLRKCFVADCTAIQAAFVAHVNRNTANRYYRFFRQLIKRAALTERQHVNLHNGLEVDESYFGPRRQRGKRGRGAAHKIIVFGVLKRQGRVYTEIIPDASKQAIMPIIRQVVASGADIYSDGWKSYDALAVHGYNHKKVKHHKNEWTRGPETHINGVESFWAWVKHRLVKFRGLTKQQFRDSLLESEWRFNHRVDMERALATLVRAFKKSSLI